MSTVKALVMSDLHLEYRNNINIPVIGGVKFLILAGDIGSNQSHLEFIKDCASKYTVIYILGNHEFYGFNLKEVRDFWNSVKIDNFHFLDNSSVVIDDIEFIGSTLWVDFNRQDFHTMYNAAIEIKDFQKIFNANNDEYITAQDIYAEFEKSYDYLKNALYDDNGYVKVLVTHYGFSHQSVHPGYLENPADLKMNHYFTNHLDNFIGNSLAKVAIHGHMHTSADYMLGDVHVVCEPVGYPDSVNPEFHFKLVDLK
jgi:hypothetical protein